MTDPGTNGDELADAGRIANAGDYTGAYIVLLDPDHTEAGMSALSNEAGVARAERISASEPQSVSEALAAGSSVVLEEIGVAVVTAAPDQRQPLMQAAANAPQVLVMERERVLSIFPAPSTDFLLGYRAAVNALVDESLAANGNGVAAVALEHHWDETRAAWGLQAIRVLESCHTGVGVRVAVLDTGVDVKHRDFVGRSITTASFISGEEAHDGHGHGTHCIGTSCGPNDPSTLPRYGVAGGADIYAGKVLSNAGSGADGGILAGINWAISNECRVISMSLGAPTNIGDTYSLIYEQVGMRALSKGAIIVAAAGNESDRPGSIKPVGHPANCPSILAVAALAKDMTVARFSCAGLNPDGGQIDIAGPGVDVLSSWPEPTGYRRISGTSMATPHVAGVLALLAGANPDSSAAELKNMLLANASRLPLLATDVGSGLVQAR